MKTKWNEKSVVDKILIIIRIIASVATAVLCVLQLSDIWDEALSAAVPLMGVVLLIQSIQERKENKGAAVVGFCCAAFIFICTIVVWFMK